MRDLVFEYFWKDEDTQGRRAGGRERSDRYGRPQTLPGNPLAITRRWPDCRAHIHNTLDMHDPTAFLTHLFDTALKAADPDHVVAPFIPAPPKGRLIVLGAGKAAAKMARAVEQAYAHPLTGMVVTRYGHGVPCSRITVFEAAHPVPDQAGYDATQQMLALAATAADDDLVLFLISGGGSALLTAPKPGLSLDEKRSLNSQLLKSGAAIDEMNCVRKHLSAVKGGKLAAAAHRARQLTLMISDVPGDDPGVIASGPTVPDLTPAAQARAILTRYAIPITPAIETALAKDKTLPMPDPGRTEFHMIASPQLALEAAATAARSAGVTPMILSDRIEGEARDVAKTLAAIALQVRDHAQPLPAPCVLLSGGETTVTVRGTGRGGRNVEHQLALALALQGRPGIHAIACDTDGVDGAVETAGAIITPDTLARARAQGLDPRASLDNNDGHGFFETLDDTVVTGPTMTNVNDFRAILIT